MSMKIDRTLLRRLTLLVLAVALTCLAITPSVVTACACTNGATQTVYTSIACCTDPPNRPTRPVAHQTCMNCQWVTTSTGCQSAPTCAF